ncbi:unnamed protein product, partial [Prorocentrum cordatum]
VALTLTRRRLRRWVVPWPGSAQRGGGGGGGGGGGRRRREEEARAGRAKTQARALAPSSEAAAACTRLLRGRLPGRFGDTQERPQARATFGAGPSWRTPPGAQAVAIASHAALGGAPRGPHQIRSLWRSSDIRRREFPLEPGPAGPGSLAAAAAGEAAPGGAAAPRHPRVLGRGVVLPVGGGGTPRRGRRTSSTPWVTMKRRRPRIVLHFSTSFQSSALRTKRLLLQSLPSNTQ